ncbi:hypothetical protein Nmel_010783, partial [Mimus melanotis]
PVTIPAGTRIAPLVPFPSYVPRANQRDRKDGGLGSTGMPQVFWTMNISGQHPQMVCTLSVPAANPPQIQLRGFLYMGADVTVISYSAWPPMWPIAPVGQAIEGVGGAAQTFVSQWPVPIKNMEEQTATVWPYITSASINLWGRDVLVAWGVHIQSN